MINISKYTKLLFLCLSSIIVFTSCEDDETVFDRIVGYEWVGDLGFADRYGPLESGLFFERNGFGSDAQCYYDDPHGDIIYELPFRWVIMVEFFRWIMVMIILCWKYMMYMSLEMSCLGCCM